MSSAWGTTSLSPTAGQLWRRGRGLLLAAAILAVAGLIIAAIRSDGEHGPLDPRSPDPHGSRAAAALLRERGIETDVVTTTAAARSAAGPDTTLLVGDPDSLSRHQRSELRRVLEQGGRTVLVAPGPAATAALAPGVRTAAPAPVQPTPPDCDFPAAKRAGDAELGGLRYAMKADYADACYLHKGLPSLLRLPADPGDGSGSARDDGDTVLLGAPDPLYNDRLDDHGNASLMLQLLGSRSHVVWYLPSAVDSGVGGKDERGLFDLLPAGWSWAAVQLGVAAVLAALWRVRRLGPLVPERLPVSVRASETTEGRARLYRQANARDRAAEALRSAARTRVAPLVGVSAGQAHSPETLTEAVAAHMPAGALFSRARESAGPAPDGTALTAQPGSGTSRVRTLLFGAAPANDAELIQLADDLDHVERRLSSATSIAHLPTDKERTS